MTVYYAVIEEDLTPESFPDRRPRVIIRHVSPNLYDAVSVTAELAMEVKNRVYIQELRERTYGKTPKHVYIKVDAYTYSLFLWSDSEKENEDGESAFEIITKPSNQNSENDATTDVEGRDITLGAVNYLSHGEKKV